MDTERDIREDLDKLSRFVAEYLYDFALIIDTKGPKDVPKEIRSIVLERNRHRVKGSDGN